MTKFPVTMEATRAEILIDRIVPDTLDIAIRNSAHFGGDMINDTWIRLTNFQLQDLMKDIDSYLSDNTIIRKIYEMPPKFGHSSMLSVEVGAYTNHELEIIISNKSRLVNSYVNETYIRLSKAHARLIRAMVNKMLT